ncbi:DUF791-domain-containing protein [Neoconidiobolus thromboides FSU 785]|nr:DUF791-domain-containing protein [Neoconidiobolus thromboides FSU 785]
MDTQLAEFKKFQYNFLTIFSLIMLCEWLQAPYIIKLYMSYGYNLNQIVNLFTIGYIAGAIVGPIIAGLADGIGRKKIGSLFIVLYLLHGFILNTTNYYYLLFGRFIAGSATTILFSVFETWMVEEHFRHNYPKPWLAKTFSLITFLNAIAAIIAGFLAEILVKSYSFVAPFNLANIILLVCFIAIQITWKENYGEKMKLFNLTNFKNSIRYLLQDNNALLIAISQSLFECSMYTFAFLWAPILIEANINPNDNLNLGYLFSLFMLSMSMGSILFNYLYNQQRIKLKFLIIVLFLFAFLALFLASLTKDFHLILLLFVVFEFTVGIYYPTISQLRNQYLPQSIKANLLALFRTPLNLMVAICLNLIPKFDVYFVLFAASILLLIAALLLLSLNYEVEIEEGEVQTILIG